MAMIPNAALGLLLAAMTAHGVGRIWRTRLADWAGYGAMTLAWGLLSACIVLRWAQAGRAPMANQYESLLWLAWFLPPIGAWAARRLNLDWAGLLASTLAAASLAAASLLDASITPLMPALRSNWLAYHVATAMAAYATLALSAGAGALYLAKAGDEDFAERVDRASARIVRVGLFLLTVGIATGSVWAQQAWASYWSWDPKETWSLITWLFYAAALHMRKTRGWTGRRFAWLCVAGFAAVLFTYFGVNYLLGGLHSYRL